MLRVTALLAVYPSTSIFLLYVAASHTPLIDVIRLPAPPINRTAVRCQLVSVEELADLPSVGVKASGALSSVAVESGLPIPKVESQAALPPISADIISTGMGGSSSNGTLDSAAGKPFFLEWLSFAFFARTEIFSGVASNC